MSADTTAAKKEVAIKFKPLKDRLFVKYSEEMEKTAGGV